MEIKVFEFTGSPLAYNHIDANSIFNEIKKYIDKKETVELSFENIETIVSDFLNTLVGNLYENYSSDDLNTYLKVKDLSDEGLMVLNAVIANAKRFYGGKNSNTSTEYC